MPNITDLTAASALNDADVLPIVQGGETKKIPASVINDQLTQINQDINTAKSDVLAIDIGTGQNYVDVISQRSVDVVYTNTTGKPITVYIQGWAAIENLSNKSFEVDGVGVAIIFGHSAHAMRATISAIIPPGSTYQVRDDNDVTVLTWVELR